MNAILSRIAEVEQAEQAAAEALLAKLFAGVVERGDVKALALFASRNGHTVTVGEVIADALWNRDYMQRAMQILVNAANGKGTQRDAQQLLADAGAKWASLEVGVVLP